MTTNSKATPNGGLSFELGAWLEHADQLDQAATEGPWAWGEPDPMWTGDYYGVWEAYDDMPPVAAAHSPVQGKADAEWIAYTRTAMPQATAALRAVLDLHHAVTCSLGANQHCGECDQEWPCTTVREINQAIGEP